MNRSDLLVPRTDAGVLVQVAVVSGISVASLVAVRHNRSLRSFVLGAWTFVVALMALRMLH